MTSEFIQKTLSVLDSVARYATTPEQREALRIARLTFHFILGRGEAGEFEDFFKGFDTDPLKPILTFTTLEEANLWLRNHPAPPHGAIIGAGGSLYTVAYSPSLVHRKLLRIPSQAELDAMDESE